MYFQVGESYTTSKVSRSPLSKHLITYHIEKTLTSSNVAGGDSQNIKCMLGGFSNSLVKLVSRLLAADVDADKTRN